MLLGNWASFATDRAERLADIMMVWRSTFCWPGASHRLPWRQMLLWECLSWHFPTSSTRSTCTTHLLLTTILTLVKHISTFLLAPGWSPSLRLICPVGVPPSECVMKSTSFKWCQLHKKLQLILQLSLLRMWNAIYSVLWHTPQTHKFERLSAQHSSNHKKDPVTVICV